MDTVSEALKQRIQSRIEAEKEAPKPIKGLPVKIEEIQPINGLPENEK